MRTGWQDAVDHRLLRIEAREIMLTSPGGLQSGAFLLYFVCGWVMAGVRVRVGRSDC